MATMQHLLLALATAGTAQCQSDVQIEDSSRPFWRQVGNTLEGDADGDFFGANVVSSNDACVLAVGAEEHMEYGGPGLVRIFRFNSTSQNYEQSHDFIGTAANDEVGGLGLALSADASTLVYQGKQPANGGTANVFDLADGAWTERGRWNGTSDNRIEDVVASKNGLVMAIKWVNATVSWPTRTAMWRFYERQAATGQWTQRGSDLDVGAEMVPDLYGRTGEHLMRQRTGVLFNDDGSMMMYSNSYGISLGSHIVRVYDWANNQWVQRGSDIEAGGSTGRAMNTAGSVIAIGGNHVKVYAWSGSAWSQRGLDLNPMQVEPNSEWNSFGQALQLSGNGNVIASSDDDNNAIYVFAWQEGSWTQQVRFYVDVDDRDRTNIRRTKFGEPIYSFPPAYDIFQLSKDGKVLVASDYRPSTYTYSRGELPGRVFVYTSLASGVLTCGRSDDDGLGAPPSLAVVGSAPSSSSGDAPSPPPSYHKLTSQVTYDIDLTAIASGSTARTEFETEFKADVATAMGVTYTAADVTINSIVSGSVVVDFSVTVLSAAVATATATFNNNIVSNPTALDNTAASATVTGSIAAPVAAAPVAAPVAVPGAKTSAASAAVFASAGAVLAATVAAFLQ